jgi:hypothetical protein
MYNADKTKLAHFLPPAYYVLEYSTFALMMHRDKTPDPNGVLSFIITKIMQSLVQTIPHGIVLEDQIQEKVGHSSSKSCSSTTSTPGASLSKVAIVPSISHACSVKVLLSYHNKHPRQNSPPRRLLELI